LEYCPLGPTGVSVSRVCLGTATFGVSPDAQEAERVVGAALDAGINFFDTANVYGRRQPSTGRARRQPPNANRPNRSWAGRSPADATTLSLATKSGGRRFDLAAGLSRRYVIQQVEHSLRRLGTDYIDVYYLHKEDHATPLVETVRAVADLVREGKIRYFGVSNYRSWRIAEICALCDRLGVDRPVVNQPYYNAMNRMPEVEQLPASAYYGLGVVPYSPLARGVLTGKYTLDAPPPADTRAGRNDKRIMQTEWRPESLRIAQTIKRHAETRGFTAGQFAIAWVLNNKLVTGTIAGPRTEAHWSDYMRALEYTFTPEDEALIDGLVPAGHPSTPGYNDPAYPIEGRLPQSGR